MRKQNDLPDLSQKEAIILGVLLCSAAQEMYGLEILGEANGLLKRGTLYVTLQRIEEKGLVKSRQETRTKPEVGIPRRIYGVTGLGAKAFEKYRDAHERLSEIWVMA